MAQAKCPQCSNAVQQRLLLVALVGKQQAVLGECQACGYRGFLLKQKSVQRIDWLY